MNSFPGQNHPSNQVNVPILAFSENARDIPVNKPGEMATTALEDAYNFQLQPDGPLTYNGHEMRRNNMVVYS